MENNFDLTKVKVVPIEQVRPNTWNPKPKGGKAYEKVKQSIATNGLKSTIAVRENDGYEIIDGEQRWTACLELGFKKILIYNEGEVTDQEAKQLTIWWQQQVPFDPMDEAFLVADMADEFGDLELPYDIEEIEEMKALANFSFDEYSDKEPSAPADSDVRTLALVMAKDKYDLIVGALDAVIHQEELQPNDRSRALELIVADYISGK